MSHELRTPLNAIIGFSEIMESGMFGPLGAERYREYCCDIHQSGQYLLDVINDILDMSKIEAGRIRLDPEQVESQLTKSHQGSGLGLAIAKSLTELHHGTIRIRSTPGTGTMVVLRLPVDRTSLRKHEIAEAAA